MTDLLLRVTSGRNVDIVVSWENNMRAPCGGGGGGFNAV